MIPAGVGFVIGFIAGLVYGLTHGRGLGSLLTALEAGLLGAVGVWIGWHGGLPVGIASDALWGPFNGLRVGGASLEPYPEPSCLARMAL